MPPSIPIRTSPAREEVRERTTGTTNVRQHQGTNTKAAKEDGGVSTTASSATTSAVQPRHPTQEQQPQQRTSSTTTTTANLNNTTTTSVPSFADSQQQQQLPPMVNGGLGMYGGAGGPATASNLGMYGSVGGGLGNLMMYGAGSAGMYGTVGTTGMYGGGATGPLSGVNQALFSIQTVIFSLGQAVQIVGMNTQALHQLFDTVTAMFDHALQTFREMRALDHDEAAALTSRSSTSSSNDKEAREELRKRKRRLKALRWAMIVSVAYGGYRLIRKVLLNRRQRQRRQAAQGHYYLPATATMHPYASSTRALPARSPHPLPQPSPYYASSSPYYPGSSPNPYSSNSNAYGTIGNHGPSMYPPPADIHGGGGYSGPYY